MSTKTTSAPKAQSTGPRPRATDPKPTADSISAQSPTTSNWRRKYAARLWFSDFAVLLLVVYGTQLLWFGWGNAEVAIRDDSRLTDVSYWYFSAFLVAVWMWALSLRDTRDYRVVGTGSTEYVRIIDISLRVFGILTIIAFLTRIDVARGYLLISLPAGILLLIIERWLWRQWLGRKRRSGDYSARVLLVGSAASATQIAREFLRNPAAGYHVVGACIPGRSVATAIDGTDIPILGGLDAVQNAMVTTAADTVAVTSTDDLPPSEVKQISWSLEAGRKHLVLAPSITDIAGPRIHSRPVSGLPLIHVETPKFSRGQRFAKRMMDLTASVLGLIVISPIMLILAGLVKATSPGPILFSQMRIGYHGRQFRMWKFRSMAQNAEDLLPTLLDQRDAGNEVLFKMTDDPRITPVGRFIRKYSLDELPQLFNVIGGSMSLVGPRPPLPKEVEMYADHVHRRFLAKPGITGAWQVGGRSTLSWDDSVRLDLAYVENWTLFGDFVIILKTFRAIVAPRKTAA